MQAELDNYSDMAVFMSKNLRGARATAMRIAAQRALRLMLLAAACSSAAAAQHDLLHAGSCDGYALKFEGFGTAMTSVSSNLAPIFANATGLSAAWWQRHDGFVDGSASGSQGLFLFTPSSTDWFAPFYLDTSDIEAFTHYFFDRALALYPEKLSLERVLSPETAASDKLDLHEWHHVALSFSATDGRLTSYLDNVVVDDIVVEELAEFDLAAAAAGGVYGLLGVYAQSESSHERQWCFRGSFDRVHLWTEPLDAADVHAHYAGNRSGHRASALAYEFDEVPGWSVAMNSGTAGRDYDLRLGRGLTGSDMFEMLQHTYARYDAPRRVRSSLPKFTGVSSAAVNPYASPNTCVGDAPVVLVQTPPPSPLPPAANFVTAASFVTTAPLLARSSADETLSVHITQLPPRGQLRHASGAVVSIGDEIGHGVSPPYIPTLNVSVITPWLWPYNSSGEHAIFFAYNVSSASATVGGQVHVIAHMPPTTLLRPIVCEWPAGVERCARDTTPLLTAEDKPLIVRLIAGGGSTVHGPNLVISRVPNAEQGTLHQADYCCDADAHKPLAMRAGETVTEKGGSVVFVPASDFSGLARFSYIARDEFGFESEEAEVLVQVIAVDDVAAPLAPAQVRLAEDSEVFIPLSARDPEGQSSTVYITSLPQHGTLYRSRAGKRGPPLRRSYSRYSQRNWIDLHGIDVLNVSSYYEGGYGDWHVLQILGEPDVLTYGEHELSWSPRHRNGDAGLESGHDPAPVSIHGFVNRTMSYSWDSSVSLATDGYTEFVEIKYAQPVYPGSVFIGENVGMGSVVRVRGRDSAWAAGRFETLWSGAPAVDIHRQFQQQSQYRTFSPPICMLAFKIDVLRIELDTSAVDAWNEIDSVGLSGFSTLPDGGLDGDDVGVVYVPHSEFAGEDSFTVAVSDCAGTQGRLSLAQPIAISVEDDADAPVAKGQHVELREGEESTVFLYAMDADSGSQLTCVISRTAEAAALTIGPRESTVTDGIVLAPNRSDSGANSLDGRDVKGGNGSVANASFPCSMQIVSDRCGADSFSYQACDGELLSLEAEVTLSVSCLPPCRPDRDLTFSFSACKWETGLHKLSWSWNESAQCSRKRSPPLPAPRQVACSPATHTQTIHEVGRIVLGGLVSAASVGGVLLLLDIHGVWRFWRKTLLLLRLLSLVGSFLLGIAMVLSGGDPFSLSCSISPVLIWTAFTWAIWPLLIKMYAFWRIISSRSLRSLSFEAKRVIGAFLAACFVQFGVALLFFVLAPRADWTDTVNLGFGHSYTYVLCASYNMDGRYLNISQQIVMVLVGLFFDWKTKSHVETRMQKSDQFWTRKVIYMLFLHVVIVSPALLSLYSAQLYISAVWLRTLSYFLFGASVCLAAVLPAYLHHNDPGNDTGPGIRRRNLSNQAQLPNAAMSYLELEKEVERLTQIMQHAAFAHGLELGQLIRQPNETTVAAPGAHANVPVPTAQEVPTDEVTTHAHYADADAATADADAATAGSAAAAPAATAQVAAAEANEEGKMPNHLTGSPKLLC